MTRSVIAESIAKEIALSFIRDEYPEEVDDFYILLLPTKKSEASDDTLAINLGELIPPASPAVYGAIYAGITFFIGKVADGAMDIAKDLTKEYLKEKIKKDKENDSSILTRQLNDEIYKFAISNGISKKKALKLVEFLGDKIEFYL